MDTSSNQDFIATRFHANRFGACGTKFNYFTLVTD